MLRISCFTFVRIINSKVMNNFSNTLIDWYKKNKRDLPWRNTSDPYLIWISEIILQQTRVAQGYDYFLRFVDRFPNVNSLAKAHEDEVLKSWQGLGYYSRARNLHVAAQSIDGEFPKTYAGVHALKGVGDYTAAAICSIAYNMPYAVVDGNVYRVLSRYLGVDTPIDTTEGKKEFALLAQELLDKKQPGLYNQAIMDFGALQCTPVSPDCFLCPLADSCVALSNGLVRKLPIKQNKIKVRNRYFSYIYVRMGTYTFIRKRTGNDIWQGLFELPMVETDTPLADEELFASDVFRRLLSLEDKPILLSVKRNVKHVLSHQIILASFYEMEFSADSTSFAEYLKIKQEDIDNYAVPKLIHTYLERIKE